MLLSQPTYYASVSAYICFCLNLHMFLSQPTYASVSVYILCFCLNLHIMLLSAVSSYLICWTFFKNGLNALKPETFSPEITLHKPCLLGPPSSRRNLKHWNLKSSTCKYFYSHPSHKPCPLDPCQQLSDLRHWNQSSTCIYFPSLTQTLSIGSPSTSDLRHWNQKSSTCIYFPFLLSHKPCLLDPCQQATWGTEIRSLQPANTSIPFHHTNVVCWIPVNKQLEALKSVFNLQILSFTSITQTLSIGCLSTSSFRHWNQKSSLLFHHTNLVRWILINKRL